jgi:hypothetical protein
MYKDPFTGRYHTQFRDYDPITCRWNMEDPAGYADGMNMYAAYMGVNGRDPLGLQRRGAGRNGNGSNPVAETFGNLLNARRSGAKNNLERDLNMLNRFYEMYGGGSAPYIVPPQIRPSGPRSAAENRSEAEAYEAVHRQVQIELEFIAYNARLPSRGYGARMTDPARPLPRFIQRNGGWHLVDPAFPTIFNSGSGQFLRNPGGLWTPPAVSLTPKIDTLGSQGIRFSSAGGSTTGSAQRSNIGQPAVSNSAKRSFSLLNEIISEANLVAAEGNIITSNQREILGQNLPVVTRRSAPSNRASRANFEGGLPGGIGGLEAHLIRQWEFHTNRTWPTNPATGRRSTPHHIIPLESGGANKWWNLLPTNGQLPNHSLPGIPGPHARGGVLRSTIQRSRSALEPGTETILGK